MGLKVKVSTYEILSAGYVELGSAPQGIKFLIGCATDTNDIKLTLQKNQNGYYYLRVEHIDDTPYTYGNIRLLLFGT